MNSKLNRNPMIIFIIGSIAIGFGLLTLKSGSFALFGGVAGKEFAGNYIPFVLWFNFFAGFFYVISGLGILFKKHWAVVIAKILALSTIFVFLAFGGMIFSGVEYEMRTVGAMTVRSTFWIILYLLSKKFISTDTPKHIN